MMRCGMAAAALCSFALLVGAPAQALAGQVESQTQRAPVEPGSARIDEIHTEHIFGFVEGSDTGEQGELEGEIQANGAFGKRTGDYTAVSNAFQVKYSPTDVFRIGIVANLAYHDVSAVPELDDRRRLAFQGVGAEIRYRFLSHATDPVGLAVSVEPSWSRIDESGAPADQFESEFAILVDKELVRNRAFAAVNLFYEPGWTRSSGDRDWEKESTIGLGAAVTNRFRPNLLLGVEARYLRAYEAAALNSFAGDAVFLGPTLCILFGDRGGLILTWSSQVAGKAVGDSGRLNLVNFERHQARAVFRLQF